MTENQMIIANRMVDEDTRAFLVLVDSEKHSKNFLKNIESESDLFAMKQRLKKAASLINEEIVRRNETSDF